MESSKEWYHDDFLISTSHTLLQPAAINAAFATDLLYWTKGMPEDALKRMLSKSLCFGVYALPKTSSELAGSSLHNQFLRSLKTDGFNRTQKPRPNRIGTAHYR